jgi:hypothetical protein
VIHPLSVRGRVDMTVKTLQFPKLFVAQVALVEATTRVVRGRGRSNG